MKITSVSNDIVKNTAKLLQKKYRKENGLFLIEGEKSIKEALYSGIKVIQVFVRDIHTCVFPENVEVIETNDAVMSKISDAKTPPPVVAVAKQPQMAIDLDKANRVVLLEGIKDAGNLGTILRTVAAFNIDCVVLYGDTIDLYNPKTVRSATGNLWKTPVVEIKDINKLQRLFQDYEKIATLPKNDSSILLKNYIPKEKVLVMFGSEADGLSTELKEFATKNITIEMSGKVESLNLGIAAGIVLYSISVK